MPRARSSRTIRSRSSARDDGAGGIARRAENHRPRSRGDVRLDVRPPCAKARRLVDAGFDRHRADRPQRHLVIHEVRSREDDLVARIEQRGCRQDERLVAAGGHDHFVGRGIDPVMRTKPVAQHGAQAEEAGVRAVQVSRWIRERLACGVDRRRRRAEPGNALSKRNDVPTFGTELCRLRVQDIERRQGDTADTIRDRRHGLMCAGRVPRQTAGATDSRNVDWWARNHSYVDATPSFKPMRWRQPSACSCDDVEQLSRHAVRLRGVEASAAPSG